MTQPIHPMLGRLEDATSDWSVGHDNHYDGWRVRHGCVLFGELHKTEACAQKVMRRERARAAIQALLEPSNTMVEAGYRDLLEKGDGGLGDAKLCYAAMLRPLVEGEGE